MSSEQNESCSEKQLFPLLDIEDVLPILNEISIFAGLSDKQLYTLFRLLEKTCYKKGEKVSFLKRVVLQLHSWQLLQVSLQRSQVYR